MRELKFRAWDKEKERYIYFNLEDLINVDGSEIQGEGSNGETIWASWFNLEDKKDQFTGLEDKHGVCIYEGDIVKFEVSVGAASICKRIGVCKHEKYYGGFGYDVEHETNFSFCILKHNETEVIGNIYEDKHILEEKNE